MTESFSLIIAIDERACGFFNGVDYSARVTIDLLPLPFDRAAEAFALPEAVLYLDGAAHGPPLRAMRAAGERAMRESATSWFGEHWRAQIETVRALAAQLFDGDCEAIALIPSAAYGLSLAARNMPLQRGDAVLLLDRQFPCNRLPWIRRCEDVGARIVTAVRSDGSDWTHAVLQALETHPDIRVLALPQVHWQDGTLLDLTVISARAREVDARLVLDLSQSLGALPAQIDAWQPDFVVSVGYKWLLGPYGLSWLWAAPDWRQGGVPLEDGWVANDGDALWRDDAGLNSTPLSGARRFDADGVSDRPRLAMADVALRQILEWQVPAIVDGLRLRTRILLDGLGEQGLDAWLPAGECAHFCALKPPAAIADALGSHLRASNVLFTQRNGRLRLAPHLHIELEQLRVLASQIGDWAQVNRS
ncbi:MAG: aminotransferase class V-fold PLP-dependent enzyme [Lysobacteraceae bacterium]